MEVPLLVEVDAAAVKHEEDCLVEEGQYSVWDAAGLRDTEVAGSDCDGKQRKGGNRVDVLRRKSRRWALLAVNCVDVLRREAEEDRRKGAAGRGAAAAERRWVAEARRWLCAAILLGRSQQNRERMRGNRVMFTLFRWMRSTATIAGARRKERREEEGCEQDLLCVSRKQRDPGPARDLEHSRAPRLQERLQGWRPLLPMCRSVGETGDRGGGRDGGFRWRSIPAK
ncbi:hypothetical protein B296_00050221 [Ensete ventricosum]|uniref:Uncharacterized protein n=1 Tax=Ensete ventricosum TaxID=4639 RepID=A0A426WVQ1_ENSVE|nr:hypothetical protein B296_00050221 [Ensete ventricosum]